MEKLEIYKKVDLTLLSPTATEADIIKICEKAAEIGTASVCVPPSFVSLAKKAVNGKTKVCTVIGFPNGYSTTSVKCAEAAEAIADGADEIDMVINLCYVKSKKHDLILNEIKRIKNICGVHILKVIIETCLLSEDEKKDLCLLVSRSGANFIKTSTGFSKSGAVLDDIILMRKYCAPQLKIKAAGGIRSFRKAQIMLENGADRIGTSSLSVE